MKMRCTVVVTFIVPQMFNKKKVSELKIMCDKYFVKESILACDTREYNDAQEIIKVKTTGVPLAIIAKYEASYEAIEEKPSKPAGKSGHHKDSRLEAEGEDDERDDEAATV